MGLLIGNEILLEIDINKNWDGLIIDKKPLKTIDTEIKSTY